MGTVRGPELRSHLDVALAWEPFDLALPAAQLERAGALIAALGGLDSAAAKLGGYDLAGAGAVDRQLASL